MRAIGLVHISKRPEDQEWINKAKAERDRLIQKRARQRSGTYARETIAKEQAEEVDAHEEQIKILTRILTNRRKAIGRNHEKTRAEATFEAWKENETGGSGNGAG